MTRSVQGEIKRSERVEMTVVGVRRRGPCLAVNGEEVYELLQRLPPPDRASLVEVPSVAVQIFPDLLGQPVVTR